MPEREGAMRELRELCRFENGSPFRPEDWADAGVPIIRIQNLNGSQEFNFFAGDIEHHVVINDGDLLFSWSGNRGTSFGPFQWRGHVGVLNQHIFKLHVTQGVDGNWLFQALRHLTPKIEMDAHGASGLVHIKKSELEKYLLLTPALPEQRRIAQILDTLDSTIESTQRIIEKLQATRQGLLHDLLTRGLDEHGKLRDPERNPELFRETELGILPEEWEVAALGQYLADGGGYFQTGPFGSQLHAREYVAEGIPVVMPQDMVNGHISEQFVARVTPERANSLGRHRLQVNDVLFSRRGDLSRCAVITEREVGWLCGTGCLLARFPAYTLLGDWLALVYTHDFGQRQVAARAVGSTMVNLNTGLLSNLLLPFPPLEEQRKIIARLQGHNGRIQHETQHLAKLQALKRGLMDDLLTGRVRVPLSEAAR